MNKAILKQIEEGASLSQIMNEWLETHPQPRFDDVKCNHPETEIRYKIDAAGRRFYKRQCLVCGASASSQLPKHTVGRSYEIPPFDTEWEDGGRQERSAAFQQMYREWSDKKSNVWKGYYNYYIRTARWRARAKKCLQDAGGWCVRHLRAHGEYVQACHVHHLNYRNLGDEQPEDLAALCRWCHNEVHGRLF